MVIITGPTSSGKTSLGLKIAKERDLDIISIDSRQMYKELNYGTGKLPIDWFKNDLKITSDYWQIDGVKIYGYDLFDPLERVTVIDFAKKIKSIMDNLTNAGRKYILIGGTGFYIEFLCWYLTTNDNRDLDVEVSVSDEKYTELSKDELQQLLPAEILEQMNHSDKNNKYRLISRLKKLNGRQDIRFADPSINNQLFVLTASNHLLYRRVDTWVDEIWPKLKIEMSTLYEKYPTSQIFNGLIYKTTLAFVKHDVDENDAIERVKFDLHAYIRRQKTWLNRYQKANIIDISTSDLYNKISNNLEI